MLGDGRVEKRKKKKRKTVTKKEVSDAQENDNLMISCHHET
jgi:hypothetical protein